MAGLTSSIVAGTALLGAGKSIGQIFGSNKKADQAQNQIENFQFTERTNPYANLTINTTAADQQTDANLSNAATSIDALQRGGVRAVLGGIPRINENNILLQNIISQDIARQEQQRDLLIAQGEEKIQNIQERREEMALQGLGQQFQTYRQDAQSGFGGLISSGLSFASAFGGFGSGGQNATTPQVPNGARVPVGAFNVTNPTFINSPINPITGLPY